MRASLLQPCASCNFLTAPELVRPLPVKAKFPLVLGTLPALRGGILWWHAWVASSMPLVGSAPPCGGQVPTCGPGPCIFT